LVAGVFALVAWSVRSLHFGAFAGSVLFAACGPGFRAFDRQAPKPSKWAPLPALCTAATLAVILWALGPGLWRWMRG